MQKTDHEHDTPTSWGLFGLAWPLGLKAVMLHGIIVIDFYLVSPLGEPALAAMGLAGAVAGLLLGVLLAFSNATQIRIAQAFGATGPTALKTSFLCGLLINVAATAIGIMLVLFFGSQIIDTFAHTPEIAAQGTSYLYVFLLVVLFEAVAQCFEGHFNGCGRTKITFFGFLIAVPINIGLSIALIYGLYGFPELGLVGAAWGSAAASATRMIFLAARFWRTDRHTLQATGWSKPTFGAALRRHWVFSVPIAGTFISVTFGNQVCMLIYAKMSVFEFAALALILPWVQTAGTFGMAWAQATGIAMAQLLGKGTAEPALDAFLSRAWRGAFVAAGLVALSYLAICLMSERIYDNLQPETVAALFTFLPILLILPFPKGSNAICGQTLRASGDTVRVMNIFIAGQWLCKVPLTAFFVLYLDLHVAWVFALVLVEELFKFPPFHLRLLKGDWKNSQVLDD
ncbi:MATE family efflux transporter [Yoonia sp. BS5-3]|uniref:MATE family efflux transporter n=1 Tax=Yoonia phaeophyticola TaxID=3137369 RepID=A0ABZ2V961_9RHOB